jgi:dTDP-glucose pyrophosphorylase
MYKMKEHDVDGGIVTFKATHPKWSYAQTDGLGNVVKVAEKDPISDNATVGFYYWKRGRDYVSFCEDMIALDQRVNGEFYVCPVYNNAIREGKGIKIYEVEEMWGLGTPEDLEQYLREN